MSEFFGEQSPNSDWGAGYDAGFGMAQKAVATAEFLERSRIIKLLEAWLNDDNADFGETLALIKGEK